ncbi:MAG: SRPBCC domain-containing protein, partial [Hyphomonadaceae bacterium]
WESRDHMIRWWGPETFTCVELEWDLTPGTPWRAKMASKEFRVTRMSGVIHEVEKHKRIVFGFAWDNDSGRDMETVITVLFSEKNGRTTQSFHQTPFSTVAARDSHVGGWNSLINKQQLYAENVAIAEGSST